MTFSRERVVVKNPRDAPITRLDARRYIPSRHDDFQCHADETKVPAGKLWRSPVAQIDKLFCERMPIKWLSHHEFYHTLLVEFRRAKSIDTGNRCNDDRI